ncbi:type II secretion system protein [Methylobacillus caricis]|uniref:type II secretion system protein n=1 Tax=Methylobacillus caricis TaxID=1971611 RepID=UPI001CFF5CBB|nr:type II secretion system protein [Methylobacillus caricis]MCB5188729.1 type II secretion system protein [Methylobacillus caricis]
MMIAISGIGLAAIGQAWHTASQREKEQELLFAGEQFRQAIARYHQETPSPIKEYPPTLAALLTDKRGPKPAHYLRRIYIDPMTASQDWGLVKEQERIVGVYSRSRLKPFKQDNFSQSLEGFSGAESYQDWRFVANQKSEGSSQANNRGLPQDTSNNPTMPNTAENPPPVNAGANADKYAACGATLDAAQLSCHSGCGALTSTACQSCLGAAFSSYRQCLR